MEPVIERPALFPPQGDLQVWGSGLVNSLMAILQQYGYRLNRVVPADASEAVALEDFANDAAAAAGGIIVGGLYRTGSTVKVRVS